MQFIFSKSSVDIVVDMAVQAMAHNHTIDVPLPLIGMLAGQDKDGYKFQEQYEIVTDWDINCAACCWTYLTKQRYYRAANKGDDTRVTYGQTETQWTQCYISPRQENSKHGQFKTIRDTKSYGRPVAGSLIKKNSTFRLYTNDYIPEPTVIGTATNVIIRVESIAVHCVTNLNINGSCLCYNNAAILELYRAKNSKPTLNGVCEIEDTATTVKREMTYPN